MPVTIRDIARHLNLSIAAVSRALDGYPDISAETRARVLQAAQELGYAPNHAARQLRRHRTEVLGFVLPSSAAHFSEQFFSEFITRMAEETTLHGFDLLIAAAEPGSPAEQRIYQSWVQGHKVDGIVINRLRENDWRLDFLHHHRLPFAAVEGALDHGNHPQVSVDSAAGLQILAAHFASQGYENIGYIGGPADLKINQSRLMGLMNGLEENHLIYHPDWTVECDMTSQGGYLAAHELLPNLPTPAAVACFNDETAIGVLHAAHELKRQIGPELGVAGFGGIDDALHSQPPLTTLKISISALAHEIVHLLITLVNSGTLPAQKPVILPKLEVRASTLRTGASEDSKILL